MIFMRMQTQLFLCFMFWLYSQINFIEKKKYYEHHIHNNFLILIIKIPNTIFLYIYIPNLNIMKLTYNHLYVRQTKERSYYRNSY